MWARGTAGALRKNPHRQILRENVVQIFQKGLGIYGYPAGLTRQCNLQSSLAKVTKVSKYQPGAPLLWKNDELSALAPNVSFDSGEQETLAWCSGLGKDCA